MRFQFFLITITFFICSSGWGEVNLSIVSTKNPLTANSPTSVSVGVASTAIVSGNAVRRGLILVNVSNATISLGIGVAAVLNSGITLYPGGSFSMDEFSFSTSAINGIAGAAASSIAVQELQ